MRYFMEEIYRDEVNVPGYGKYTFVIATYGARDDRYAFGSYHEVIVDPEHCLPVGHRGFKEEVIATMREELDYALHPITCDVPGFENVFAPISERDAEVLAKALKFMEGR